MGTEDGLVKVRSLAENLLNHCVSSAGVPRPEDLTCDRIPASAVLSAGVGVDDVLVVGTSSYERGVGYKEDRQGESWKRRRKKDIPQDIPVLRLRGGGGEFDEDESGRRREGGPGLPDSGRPKKPALYSQHRFTTDLGFGTMRDMLEITHDDEQIEEDTPRHLIIKDKGDTKFSRHPKRMMIMALKKFLEIQDDKLMPLVNIWTGAGGVEVNVEVKCDVHAEKLLATRSIFGVEVSVEAHRFRNCSRARVWDNEGFFAAFTDEELVDILRNRAVVGVQREEYMDKKNNMKVKGKRYRLTFNKRVPPTVLRFPGAGIRMETELYIPPPMQCFHCQQLGHSETNCKNKSVGKVCFTCGVAHDGEIGKKCKAHEAYCVNCRGKHSSSSRDCPAYQQEARIKRIATERREAPRDIVLQMKSVGEYIDYKTRKTTAHKVQAVQNEIDQRLKPIEGALQDITGMVTHLLQVGLKRPAYTEQEGVGMVVDEPSPAEQSLMEENKRLREQIKAQESLSTEVDRLREEVRRLQVNDSKYNDTGALQQALAENRQLKEDMAELRNQVKALSANKSTNVGTEDVEKPLREEIRELKKKLVEKDRIQGEFITKTKADIAKAEQTTNKQAEDFSKREEDLRERVAVLLADKECAEKLLVEAEEKYASEKATMKDDIIRLTEIVNRTKNQDRSRTPTKGQHSHPVRDRSEQPSPMETNVHSDQLTPY